MKIYNLYILILLMFSSCSGKTDDIPLYIESYAKNNNLHSDSLVTIVNSYKIDSTGILFFNHISENGFKINTIIDTIHKKIYSSPVLPFCGNTIEKIENISKRELGEYPNDKGEMLQKDSFWIYNTQSLNDYKLLEAYINDNYRERKISNVEFKLLSRKYFDFFKIQYLNSQEELFNLFEKNIVAVLEDYGLEEPYINILQEYEKKIALLVHYGESKFHISEAQRGAGLVMGKKEEDLFVIGLRIQTIRDKEDHEYFLKKELVQRAIKEKIFTQDEVSEEKVYEHYKEQGYFIDKYIYYINIERIENPLRAINQTLR